MKQVTDPNNDYTVPYMELPDGWLEEAIEDAAISHNIYLRKYELYETLVALVKSLDRFDIELLEKDQAKKLITKIRTE